MQLQPIEAGAHRHLSGTHVIVAHLVHVGAIHLARHLVSGAPTHWLWPHDLPIVGGEWRIHRFPAELSRAFRAGMAELDGDFGISLGVDKIHDALPALLMLVTIKAGAAGRNSSLGGHASHFGKDQPGSALRTFSVMHKMPVVRITFYRTILRHRRNHDTVFAVSYTHLTLPTT